VGSDRGDPVGAFALYPTSVEYVTSVTWEQDHDWNPCHVPELPWCCLPQHTTPLLLNPWTNP